MLGVISGCSSLNLVSRGNFGLYTTSYIYWWNRTAYKKIGMCKIICSFKYTKIFTSLLFSPVSVY